MSLVKLENRVGKPVQAGDYKIFPIEKSLQVQPPGMRGFLFWRRPAKVLVEYPDGQDALLPIPDLTRQAQIVLWSLALIGILIFGLLWRKR